MENTLVILSKEFMTRINIALGEIPAKFAIPVINELQTWIDKAEQAPHELLAVIEAHLAPMKAKIAADKAAAEKAVADEEAKVKGMAEMAANFLKGKLGGDVAAVREDVAKVEAPVEAVVANVEKAL